MNPTDHDDNGEFQRAETVFRERIQTDPDAPFTPGPDRYHLYIARPCPWAHGTVLVRRLLGLESVISMDVLDPYREDEGWQFSAEKPGCTEDSVHGSEYLAEIYRRADPSYSDRVSVPVLWDTHRDTIVNNESVEIMKMLATAFTDYQTHAVDLYPADERATIDRIIDALYDPINNGVYRAGFARSQSAYETAVTDLFDALEYWDAHLNDHRYLAGDRLTLADLRLFTTLVRFDHVYHTHFKCNANRIVDYDNLWGFTRDIYQLHGVADTVNIPHIKEHYYTTHTDINPRGIIATGPDLDFTRPHDRDCLPGRPPAPIA